MAAAEEKTSPELQSFLSSGIYHLDGSKSIVFVDPVRILNDSYRRFRVSPSSYYSRSFSLTPPPTEASEVKEKKRKRKKKSKPIAHPNRGVNERERASEKRHQEARSFLVKALKIFREDSDLQSLVPHLVKSRDSLDQARADEQDFITLCSLWQAPLYEISLRLRKKDAVNHSKGDNIVHHATDVVAPLFNNLISNGTDDDVEAEFGANCYILPRRSSFYMSDLRQVHNLVPAQPRYGFNLIVIDPPWENASVNQKAAYPTLPNKHFLYLPVKKLAHEEGALVALWLTNREKLHIFVEEELFPSWGVRKLAIFYWLKVKPDGSLISELDLFHHRPYEPLIIGYIDYQNGGTSSMKTFEHLQNTKIFLSIPGSYSRKPPLEKLLLDHIPGPKPAKCIELFARELSAGWTSWGNEPLRFQDSVYFMDRMPGDGEPKSPYLITRKLPTAGASKHEMVLLLSAVAE